MSSSSGSIESIPLLLPPRRLLLLPTEEEPRADRCVARLEFKRELLLTAARDAGSRFAHSGDSEMIRRVAL